MVGVGIGGGGCCFCGGGSGGGSGGPPAEAASRQQRKRRRWRRMSGAMEAVAAAVTVLPALCRAWRQAGGPVPAAARSRDGAPASRLRPKLRPAAGRACPPPSPQSRRSGRSAASAGHRRRGPAVADLTNFDAARWPARAEETARAARRRRWLGDPAARAAGSGDAGVGPVGVHPEPSGRVAAATLQRLVGSLTESLGNLGPKLRIDGAASWRRDVRANCGAIVAAIVRHTTRRAPRAPKVGPRSRGGPGDSAGPGSIWDAVL
jgi:hypothetical protein